MNNTRQRRLGLAMNRLAWLISVMMTFVVLASCAGTHGLESKERAVNGNKETVQKYMEGFRRSDHAMVLSCLTDDVEWIMPGAFHLVGKEAFDKEIENPAFVGSPTISVTRLEEAADIVFAEGTVRGAKRDGGTLNAVFCDVFVMRDGRIHQLTTYLMVMP